MIIHNTYGMVDPVTVTIIAALVTSVTALAVSIVTHLKSSTCWGVSVDFTPSTVTEPSAVTDVKK